MANVKADARKVIINQMAAEVAKRQEKRRKLVEYYLNEDQVIIAVAPSYANYVGKIMPIIVNGIKVTIPCDGSDVKLPATFAAEVKRRIRAIDAQELRAKKMSLNAQGKIQLWENRPGEINLI